jgi:hypothetical protein
MYHVTAPRNNLELLSATLPHLKEDLELYEVLSHDIDGTLYMPITTPDVKLHYPEPFVASPSFMHEDITFLHVLHYQYWL